MTLSGACAFLIYLVSSSTVNLLVSMGFGLVSTMGFNALDALGVELFPTHLRLDFASFIYLIIPLQSPPSGCLERFCQKLF